MIRFSTFGKIDLRSSTGRPLTSVLSQPRRLALLVFLCADGRGRLVRRDVLLGVFWPDHPQDKARHALSQAIHFLKRELGPGLIVGQGSDELGLSPTRLSCDAWEFNEAITAGDFNTALQLYQGDFLPGFFVDSAADFEQWMELRRASFRRSAEDGAWQLAASEETNGNAVAAATWGRRSSELSNGDEVALRRLILLLDRLGDRAGALQAYQSFASRLREEFGVEPSDETKAALERAESSSGTGHESGHKPAATRAAEAQAPTPTQIQTAEPEREQQSHAEIQTVEPQTPGSTGIQAGAAPRSREKRDRPVLTAALSLAFFLAFGSLWGVAQRSMTNRASSSGAGRVSLVIHGTQHATGASRDLAEALTAEITGRLARLDSVDVIAQYNDPPYAFEKSNVSRSPESYVLRTNVLETPQRTRVNAVLIEPASGSALGRVVLDLHGSDLTALIDTAADQITAFARKQLGREMRELRWQRERSTPAARSFVRLAVRQREYADSLRKRAAIPAAIAGYRSADSLLLIAAQEAPNWNEPTIQRGETSLRLMWTYLTPANWNVQRARSVLAQGYLHAQAAVAADESDAAAWESSGVIARMLWATTPTDSASRADQYLRRAEVDLRKATSLDSGRPRAWSTFGAVLEARGSYAEANLAARRAYESDSFLEDASDTLVRLFSTSLEVDDRRSAEHWCSELQLKRPDSWVSDYCQLALVAWKPNANAEDIVTARRLIDQSDAAGRADKITLSRFQMMAAVVAAHAGHLETASAVAAGARSSSGSDPELVPLEAWYLLAAGRNAEAINLLDAYAAANRVASSSVIQSRRFRTLRSHPIATR